jgi:hypothetical protein
MRIDSQKECLPNYLEDKTSQSFLEMKGSIENDEIIIKINFDKISSLLDSLVSSKQISLQEQEDFELLCVKKYLSQTKHIPLEEMPVNENQVVLLPLSEIGMMAGDGIEQWVRKHIRGFYVDTNDCLDDLLTIHCYGQAVLDSIEHIDFRREQKKPVLINKLIAKTFKNLKKSRL